KLNSLLSSLNKSLSEKDKLIVNLTAELNKTRKENEILKKWKRVEFLPSLE
ncbi:MAG: hypothetical protein OD814_001780, partial [Candidatus Alkanophagales archaeon MCA70_species_1]|nr:hypothetical protein [Candidatus Alkanophaga volatiphilum]